LDFQLFFLPLFFYSYRFLFFVFFFPSILLIRQFRNYII
jgi:hypothetical protein